MTAVPTYSQVATNLDKVSNSDMDLTYVDGTFVNLREQWGEHRIGFMLFPVIEEGGTSASRAESAHIVADLSVANGFPRDQFFGVRRRKEEEEGKTSGPKLEDEEAFKFCIGDLVDGIADKLVDKKQTLRSKYTNYGNQKVKTAEDKIAELVERGDQTAAKLVSV